VRRGDDRRHRLKLTEAASYADFNTTATLHCSYREACFLGWWLRLGSKSSLVSVSRKTDRMPVDTGKVVTFPGVSDPLAAGPLPDQVPFLACTDRGVAVNKFLSLTFADDIAEVVRQRVCYSLRVFAAIFGYSVAEEAQPGMTRCFYGDVCSTPDDHFRIPARYSTASGRNQELLKWRYAGEDFHLFYGIDPGSGRPDWLGEIFEWLSCSHERSAAGRDSLGRIPYSSSIFGERHLSPRKPFATMLMASMENELRGAAGVQALAKAPSPLPGVEHMVICSHDIDFHYTNKRTALVRLAKNLGIACRPYRSWSFAMSNSRMILDLLSGKRVGDYLPALYSRGVRANFQSTLFAVPRQLHRRDPNYQLSEIAARLKEGQTHGFSVGLHASYNSIVEENTLAPETAALQQALGRKAIGNRQHWLRFDSHENLFQAVDRAKIAFDSSLGFANRVGFRNGASFAFPPYNFKDERPYEFLEIPLAIMDGSLEATTRNSRENPQAVADEVLAASRRWSWGGISVLWHNPIEAISVPKEINQVFWDCVKDQEHFCERWMSADEFLRVSLGRYQAAGLLRGMQIDA